MSGEGLVLAMASMWVSGAGMGFIIRGFFRPKTKRKQPAAKAQT